jgi:TPR repeat protein
LAESVKKDLQELEVHDARGGDTTKFLKAKGKDQFDTWKKAAESGIPEGQVLFGLCYYCGTNVAEDYEEGIKWFRKADEQGNVVALCLLGHCYYYGDGVPEDEKEALRLYRKAAAQGYAEAQYKVGDCYFYGSGGLPEDEEEGIRWYRLAAEQGYVAENELDTLREWRLDPANWKK